MNRRSPGCGQMARKPLFEDIEDGFLGVGRANSPFRPVPKTNPTGVESEITSTKMSSSKETVSNDDDAPSAKERLEKNPTDSKEGKEYVCCAPSCNYRGKALHHWKIHARHSGHLSFGCNLVQGDSFTYIPFEGPPDNTRKAPTEPAKDIEYKDRKIPATSKLSESEKEILEAAVKYMTKDKRYLFTDHPEFLNHWERHWKGRSRIALVTLALVLAHSLIWYNHYDIGYEPNNSINAISILLVGSVIVYFLIALFGKFPWEDYKASEHMMALVGNLGVAAMVFFPESMFLQGMMMVWFVGAYVNTAEEVSAHVFEEKAGVSKVHRLALAMRYQAMIVAVCSFLLAAAENYLIG